MTRRIVGADTPQQSGAVVPQVSQVQADLTPAINQFGQAAARTEQTYQAQFAANNARAAAIASKADKQVGTGITEVFQGLAQGIQMFGEIQNMRIQAEQAKLQAEKRST